MTNGKVEEAGWNLDNSYSRLPKKMYSQQNPTPVNSPGLIKLNESLAESLGLNVQELKSEESLAVFAGNRIPEGATPLAQAYAGHQFGHFNMLGDGRAVLLGEQLNSEHERIDIQLKGSGRTPYSRGGDGRAALGPMLREYIISEAMHGLGIPTTRSLAVVTTGESILRETKLPGAILTRTAASHIRVGTFQFAAQWGTEEELRELADYTIDRHYSDLPSEENRYLSFLKAVVNRQALLISKWQLVGFIHGVMNTDNMTISGETIDYGPCAFMDTYDPATVFSSIDVQGRYAYGNQPNIAGWNLARFAETLLPLLHDDIEEAVKIAQDVISGFLDLYDSYWLNGMRSKLGIYNEEAEDLALVENLLNIMEKYRADYTNTFRALTFDNTDEIALADKEEFKKWYDQWKERQGRQKESKTESVELMKRSNPAVIPRNHRVEEALEAAVEKDDYQVMDQLLEALSNPYAHSPHQSKYCSVPANPDGTYRTYCGT
ncbi:protein adenylyltransferase SelO [Metabacillus schmidteae]|uniref:protein adenylyltransferase SelO n=1 Tax=Metabacillus schmidteae TaxID=2730405 RepID=UPI00158F49BB|nr:YdiU family protein [Metabacillus schmidteae]